MILTSYARQFIGVPYIYGGKCASVSLDCSGFVQEVLSFAGVDIPGDQNAQAYFEHFSKHGTISNPLEGALAFYGPSTQSIHHINYLTSPHTILGAMGGDQECVSLGISEKKRAFVKERPIEWMKDVCAILMPNYPAWVKEII